MSNSAQSSASPPNGDEDGIDIPIEAITRLAEAVHVGELRHIDRLVGETPSRLSPVDDSTEELRNAAHDDAG